MVLSKYQKLQELGIDIWKKRSEQEAIIFQDEVYLTDRNCILCLGKKDEEVSEEDKIFFLKTLAKSCLLYTSPSPRDGLLSRMPSSA